VRQVLEGTGKLRSSGLRRGCMKTKLVVVSCLVAVGAIGSYALWPGAGGAAPLTKRSDHALYDETSGDQQVFCRGNGPFQVHVAMRAINADAVMRVRFLDGDFVDYPIPQDTSFSLTQAAGGTEGVDRRIRVKSAPGAAGALVGWMSANGLDDTLVTCGTRQ
jgi:hypothetical protein